MKRVSILIVSFLLSFSLYAQKDTVAYINTYGGIQNDVCNQIKATNDGGYIMIGTSNSFGCGNTDFYAVKVDSVGNHKWSKTYGGSENEEGFSVTETFDHGFAFVGFTDSYGAGGYDVLLVKTDSAGNFQWQRTYGGEDWDFGYSIQQLPDSGYIICGLTYSYGPGNGNAYVIRTNKLGDTLWTKAMGGAGGYSVGNSVCVKNDSLYAIVGSTTSFGRGDTNVYFILMDDKGIIKKDTTYGSTRSNIGNSIRETLDQGFVIFGSTDSVQPGTPSEMMIKTDSNGKMLYMHIYHAADNMPGIGYDAIQMPDASYLAISTSNAYGLGACAMRIWHFDLNGLYLSAPSFGGIGYQVGYSIAAAKNGNAVFVGATNSPGYTVGLFDIYTVRVKKDSIVQNYSLSINQYKDTCLCTLGIGSQVSFIPEVKLFPNPVSSSATILVQGTTGIYYSLNMYNSSGQQVIGNVPLQPIAHGQSIGYFEKGNLASGVYLYGILNQSGVVVATGKIIVE